MKVLGITGGVGAGKSTILNDLRQRHGARLLAADEVGRELQKKGMPGYEAIVKRFGTGILQEDLELDRKALASIVFQDPSEMEILNAIMHPMIRKEIESKIDRFRKDPDAPFLVLESALFFEDHYEAFCDQVWFVHTDPEIRVKRLILSRGYTREKALAMMKMQMSDQEYIDRCDYVIDNSSEDLTAAQTQIDRGLYINEFL